MKTALGDLNIGRPGRRRNQSRRGVIIEISRQPRFGRSRALGFEKSAYPFTYVRDFVNTHEQINFGELFSKRPPFSLRKTACADENATGPRCLQPGHLPQGLFRLFHSRSDERAGIYYEHIRFFRVIGEPEPGLAQVAGHHLGIHQVLGAAEGHYPHRGWG